MTMVHMTEERLKRALKFSQFVTVNGVEYSEHTKVSEMCAAIPFIEMPVYRMTDCGTRKTVYLALDEGRVGLAHSNTQALQCSVCSLGRRNCSKFIQDETQEIKVVHLR